MSRPVRPEPRRRCGHGRSALAALGTDTWRGCVTLVTLIRGVGLWWRGAHSASPGPQRLEAVGSESLW
jgi:hypothetical protein